MSAIKKLQRECLERLLELKAPSRLKARDTSLFTAHPEDAEKAERLLGWTTLSSKPPYPIAEISRQAQMIRDEGLEAVVLIGQGGSSQAAMTVTKLHELSQKQGVVYRTMDSLSPIFVNHILGSSDPARTLYIVASKSGSTIEPLMLERVVWHYVSAALGESQAGRRFAALTDPGSGLEQLAREKSYRLILPTPADVGGRFSALTPFALFPAALIGLDIVGIVAATAETEQLCATDSPENPAARVASFLYGAYLAGRDKFSLIMPPSGQTLGLWVEQLVAESLGKEGKGILPNIELDASILAKSRTDRSVITYEIGDDEGFRESLAHIDKSIPARHITIAEEQQVFSRFIIWEYAVAFMGILMEVFPFDQPDVEVTKKLVRGLLLEKNTVLEKSAAEQNPTSDNTSPTGSGIIEPGLIPIEISDDIVTTLRVGKALAVESSDSIDKVLRTLFASLRPGDFFSLNAFVPFRGYGRREALERIRNRVASRLGVVACLEIGPRFLHSTGQFHKGGPNTGVFLVLSTDEIDDIHIPGEDFTLGTLAATQAQADFSALASRARRAIHIHLKNNDAETLARFADRV